MGRKLNPNEAVCFGFSDIEANTGLNCINPTRSQILQQQIAQQLGISPNEFTKAPLQAGGVQKQGVSEGGFDIALHRECSELIEAYTRITDLSQRLRCLQAVQEAASLSVGADPASRGE